MNLENMVGDIKAAQIQFPSITKPDKMEEKDLHSVWQEAPNNIFVKQS